ncbi:hypothetical protein [Desulfonema magnum]|uniref:Uncharacterized protein n=1 Tax=Desulfonema magnum TaxID=45655 RepID=A0A975BMF2_9BACT|nr:hypothetical protein [Desulfonema magnum]QTA87858.1 Uncharacterized protein dnm_038960 [Desulfonema magnum]
MFEKQTCRPYGTRKHGLAIIATNMPSLRDSEIRACHYCYKHAVPTELGNTGLPLLLQTCRPYGTRKHGLAIIATNMPSLRDSEIRACHYCYKHAVPTGLGNTGLAIIATNMPSLRDSEIRACHYCYKHAVPTGLGNTGLPLLLQTCRPYGTRKHGACHYCYKYAVPTGLGNTGLPLLLQTCRPYRTRKHGLAIIATNMPSLRDSETRACHYCYKHAVPTGLGNTGLPLLLQTCRPYGTRKHGLAIIATNMPSLRDSETRACHYCYKHAVPTGLGNTGLPLLLQTCRPYGTRKYGLAIIATNMPSLRDSETRACHYCYKHAVPTGLGNTGLPLLLQTCRPYGTRKYGLVIIATNMPSLRDSETRGLPLLLQICRPYGTRKYGLVIIATNMPSLRDSETRGMSLLLQTCRPYGTRKHGHVIATNMLSLQDFSNIL